MARIALLPLAWACQALLTASPALAHGLDAGRMTVELEHTALMVVATPKAAQFEFADDNGDGRLNRLEVKAHRPAMRAVFDGAVSVTADDGATPSCERTDVSTPVSGSSPLESTDHVRVTMRCRFANPPSALRIRYGFASSEVVVVEAVRLRRPEPVGGRPSMPVRVGPAERVALGSGEATARMLVAQEAAAAGAPTEPPAPQAFGFGGFVWHGADHVLFGLDHILFIVALVLATSRRRELALAVTAFTMTHTLALAAVIEGWIAAPPGSWVEPGIALSIALTAAMVALNASRTPGSDNTALLTRAAGVNCTVAAIFGLLHGLGMASTALETFADAASSMLIPFTLGAELSQLAIAAVASVLVVRFLDSSPLTLRSLRFDRRHAAGVLVLVGVTWFGLRVTNGDEAKEPLLAQLASETTEVPE